MKRNAPSQDPLDIEAKAERHLTAFSAVKQTYGLQIKVAGCFALRPTRNPSEGVIGMVELDDQVVPILDARQNNAADITDSCSIVLFENQVGPINIVTGRLYESACQVFDLIVEHMDHPGKDVQLYAASSQASVPASVVQAE